MKKTMKKKTVVMSAIAAAFVLSAGCMTVFAAESEEYGYLQGQQRSAERNDLYKYAEQLPSDERDAFLAENGIGEEPYSEEAAAAYSYVAGRQHGMTYRQSDDTERNQDTSGYSFRIGQERGAGYNK